MTICKDLLCLNWFRKNSEHLDQFTFESREKVVTELSSDLGSISDKEAERKIQEMKVRQLLIFLDVERPAVIDAKGRVDLPPQVKWQLTREGIDLLNDHHEDLLVCALLLLSDNGEKRLSMNQLSQYLGIPIEDCRAEAYGLKEYGVVQILFGDDMMVNPDQAGQFLSKEKADDNHRKHQHQTITVQGNINADQVMIGGNKSIQAITQNPQTTKPPTTQSGWKTNWLIGSISITLTLGFGLIGIGEQEVLSDDLNLAFMYLGFAVLLIGIPLCVVWCRPRRPFISE